MKIYTRTGDSGDTGLFGGGRVRKHHARVEAYGTVDELNSWLGLVRAQGVPARAESWLARIQDELFKIGSDLATPLDVQSDWVVRIEPDAVAALEAVIDEIEVELPPLTSFILPGGIPSAAALHVARTVCRRAERCVVVLADTDTVNGTVIVYLNRLSDLLFVLARWLNVQAGEPETRWNLRSSD